MKIDIKTHEKSQGIFKKKKYYEVVLDVTLSDTERQVIQDLDIAETIILQRPALAFSPPDAVIPLRFKHLVAGGDPYTFTTPHEAGEYKEQLVAALKNAKAYLDANASGTAEDTSFEL